MKGAHTMRIAHFSDLHFGAKTLSEADRCFGAAIDRAIAAGAQAAVISGDATDHALCMHRRPHAWLHRFGAWPTAAPC